MLLTASSALKA